MPKNQLELAALIQEMAMTNSESAYKALFRTLFNPIRNFSFSIVKSSELAEEVASDVLFMLWYNREKLCEVKNIKYYAFTAAKNKSLNILKKDSGKQVISLDEVDVDIHIDYSNPELILLQGELKLQLETAIKTLPKQCKLVFKLIKEEGFSYKEVAEMLDISPKTVDAHLVNAVRKLSAILKTEFNIKYN
ncbi:RNA polymerase sigma-70 factor [Albibacterium bauzanense]|uniref:RNA polymerase sigma-70 factor (ECF subfamily) n=1 Tax=Albibacterium bauzanense TaxID=653929 RepID=A0A4R1M1J7_9SPHI|nr:RNA polymerase sigma-70 factor [Albibacterium bauzanense]TCK85848.1 RNA polymerase sigma-70 factor (ECF subfamily) [Albibacterium bauzanense]